MMKNKAVIISSVISLIIIFFIYGYYDSQLEMTSQKKEQSDRQLNVLKSIYFDRIAGYIYQLPKVVPVLNESSARIDLLGEYKNKVLAVRIHETDCQDCINHEAKFINKLAAKIGKQNIIVLGQSSSLNSLLLLNKQFGFSYKTFKIDSLRFIDNSTFDDYNVPYVFILNKDKISFLHFPDKNLSDSISESYYHIVEKNL